MSKDEKKLSERIEIIVGESKEVIKQAYYSSGVESIGESVRDAVDRALSRRDNVVMVRLNAESLRCLDDLVEAEIVSSRSEAVAFLVSEGIRAQSELFARIERKVEQLRRVKQELRDLLDETPPESTADEATPRTTPTRETPEDDSRGKQT